MDIKKLGVGLGAFAAGAAAWTWGASRYGDRAGRLFDWGADQGEGGPDGRVVPGDQTTSLTTPRPATMAAAPVGQAEADRRPAEGDAPPAAGHTPTDLLSDEPVTIATRAPEHFRPDPTATPTAEEREALRPATGPAPTLAADRGSGFSEAAGAA